METFAVDLLEIYIFEHIECCEDILKGCQVDWHSFLLSNKYGLSLIQGSLVNEGKK